MNFKQYVYFRCSSWVAVKTALFELFLKRNGLGNGEHPVKWFEAQEQAFLAENGLEATNPRYFIGDGFPPCPEHGEPVLPDENDNCSLCGKHSASRLNDKGEWDV